MAKKASTRDVPVTLPEEPPHPAQLPAPPDKPPKPDKPHPGKPGKDKAGAHDGRPGRERPMQAGLQEQQVTLRGPSVTPMIFPGHMRVRAMKVGFFDNLLRRPGDVFDIPAEAFSVAWMEVVDDA